MFVNVESKKKIKQNVASLARGAVGKGAFAECSGNYARQLCEKFSQLGCSQLC
jgi:hypothetical protein